MHEETVFILLIIFAVPPIAIVTRIVCKIVGPYRLPLARRFSQDQVGRTWNGAMGDRAGRQCGAI